MMRNTSIFFSFQSSSLGKGKKLWSSMTNFILDNSISFFNTHSFIATSNVYKWFEDFLTVKYHKIGLDNWDVTKSEDFISQARLRFAMWFW